MAVLHVCTTCRAGGPGPEFGPVAGRRLHDRLRGLVPSLAPALDLRETSCLASCERGCSAAIAAPGKWTVLLGRLHDGLAEDLLRYAAAFDASPTGTVMPSRRPASLAAMVQGRTPPEAASPPVAALPVAAPEVASPGVIPSRAISPGAAIPDAATPRATEQAA